MRPQTKMAMVLLMVLVFMTVFLGCQKQEGPVERMGKEIDKAVEKTEQQIKEVGGKIQEATEKTGKEIDKAVESVTGHIEKAGKNIQGATKEAKR